MTVQAADRASMPLTPSDLLEQYIEALENEIDNFDDEYLQELQATRDTAAEILEANRRFKPTQTGEKECPTRY